MFLECREFNSKKTPYRHFDLAVLHVEVIDFDLIAAIQGSLRAREVVNGFMHRITAKKDGKSVVRYVGGSVISIKVTVDNPLGVSMIEKSVRAAAKRTVSSSFPQGIGINVGVVKGMSHIDDFSLLLEKASTACKVAHEKSLSVQSVRYRENDPEIKLLEQRRAHSKLASNVEREAIQGRYYLRRQPIVSLSNSEAIPRNYEILIGIKNNVSEQFSVPHFIHELDRYKKTKILDAWVIKQLVSWCGTNVEELKTIDRLHVNLSGSTLNDDKQMGMILDLLNNSELPASKICFEVTETNRIESLDIVADFMKEARQLSCQFSLDDFGVGFCSFEYLDRLPIDTIKIDGSFIRKMHQSKKAFSIVKAIQSVARDLEKATVAEWVESQFVLEQVRALGIDYGQGAVFGLPTAFSATQGRVIKTAKPSQVFLHSRVPPIF